MTCLSPCVTRASVSQCSYSLDFIEVTHNSLLSVDFEQRGTGPMGGSASVTLRYSLLMIITNKTLNAVVSKSCCSRLFVRTSSIEDE